MTKMNQCLGKTEDIKTGKERGQIQEIFIRKKEAVANVFGLEVSRF